MENIDRKFAITAISKSNTYTEKDGVFFKAADAAFDRSVLDAYKRRAIQLGAHSRQIHGIDLLILRVERFKAENPEKVKVPDVDEGEEEAFVNRPNE